MKGRSESDGKNLNFNIKKPIGNFAFLVCLHVLPHSVCRENFVEITSCDSLKISTLFPVNWQFSLVRNGNNFYQKCLYIFSVTLQIKNLVSLHKSNGSFV